MGRSFALFSPVFALVYAVLYVAKLPVFVYHPLRNELALERLPPPHGPGMLWYGWIAASLLAGLAAVWLVPSRWAARAPASASWIAVLVVMALVLVEESSWFFR